MFLGSPREPATPRRVEAGQPADLCVLAAPPAEVLNDLDAAMVATTIIGGDVVFERR
jgi:predicted amidohydrolase YtcJ